MEQYDMPALVEADPNANATDLLIDRVKETPDLPLFALPTSDGGWSDVTAGGHRDLEGAVPDVLADQRPVLYPAGSRQAGVRRRGHRAG